MHTERGKVIVKPSLGKLAWLFTWVSITTPGGGYSLMGAMMPHILAKKWLDEPQIQELFALAQAIPGPLGFSMAMLVGHKLRGFPGALVCSLASIIPPSIIVLMLHLLSKNLKSGPILDGITQGSYAVALGLVASVFVRTIKEHHATPLWTTGAILLGILMLIFPQYFLGIFFTFILMHYGLHSWKLYKRL